MQRTGKLVEAHESLDAKTQLPDEVTASSTKSKEGDHRDSPVEDEEVITRLLRKAGGKKETVIDRYYKAYPQYKDPSVRPPKDKDIGSAEFWENLTDPNRNQVSPLDYYTFGGERRIHWEAQHEQIIENAIPFFKKKNGNKAFVGKVLSQFGDTDTDLMLLRKEREWRKEAVKQVMTLYEEDKKRKDDCMAYWRKKGKKLEEEGALEAMKDLKVDR